MDKCRMNGKRCGGEQVSRFFHPEQGLAVYYAGSEQCDCGHMWGGIRDHFLLHVVESGCGRFSTPHDDYVVEPAGAFLIYPKDLVHYRADDRVPWRYHWIGFGGSAAEGLLARTSIPGRSCVFSLGDIRYLTEFLSVHEQLKSQLESGRRRYFATVGILYSVLQILTDAAGNTHSEEIRSAPAGHTMWADTWTDDEANAGVVQTGRHVRAVQDYIRNNFSRRMTIEETARHIGVSRKHLSAVVKRECGRTPQALLAEYRLDIAKHMLERTDLTIGDIARSCGYGDQLLFARVFRREIGCPPSEYRKRRSG